MEAISIIREATEQEDLLIAEHFYQMWQDINVPEEKIHPNWQENTLTFIRQSRQDLAYKAFVAEATPRVVGSVSCQIFAGLYPNVFKAEYRKYGYIWGVYVEPSYRLRGIGKQLTTRAVSYLKEIGCTRAVLNASPAGKPMYESLGFSIHNAMQLDLI